jgi:hypothetical protein
VEDAGLGSYFLYSAIHSVGVISVDNPMFNAPWGGLRVEDGFLITDSGAERLNITPYKIQK